MIQLYMYIYRYVYMCKCVQFSSVQLLSRVWLFVTPWIAACQASLSIINSQSLLKVMAGVGDAIQPSHPLSSPSPPAPNPSQHQGLFQWVNSLHEVAKIPEFQLQHIYIYIYIFLAYIYTIFIHIIYTMNRYTMYIHASNKMLISN